MSYISLIVLCYMVYQFAGTTVTKHYKLDGLEQQKCIASQF